MFCPFRTSDTEFSVGEGIVSESSCNSASGLFLCVYRDGVLLRSADVNQGDLLIGRGKDCDIVLDEGTVSTHHARVRRWGDRYELEDLNSRNDTILEGRKIKGLGPQPVYEGQNFQICGYFIQLQSPRVKVEEAEESSSSIRASVDLATSSDVDFRPAKLEETLRAVLEVGRMVGSTLDLKEILDKTLEALFVIFTQADRGFIYIEEPGPVGQELTPTAHRIRRRPPSSNTISRAVLDQVLKKGMALCCEDIANHAQLLNSESLNGEGIRTMLCAPILDRDRKPIGLIQLDARSTRLAFEPKDLDLLVAVVGQLAVAVQNSRLHARLLKSMETEKGMSFAREVQLALLPEQPPRVPGFSFWHHYDPARDVGGDYFGYFPVNSLDEESGQVGRHWIVTVADVVGKGMGAALLMAKLSAEVQLAVAGETDPQRILERFNRRIGEIAMSDKFVTMVLGTLDVDRGIFRFVSAGHPAPALRRGDGQVVAIGEEQNGLPLGVDEQAIFNPTEVTLEPGDLIVLYTDGITESHDHDLNLFGSGRLHDVLASSPPLPEVVGPAILRAVSDHARGVPQSDDITLICLRRDS